MESEGRVPQHVSIIMDGNGRWAREHGHERVYGHKNGVESVRAVTEAAVETGVRYLSLYAFSEENWSRPDSEVGYLMQLMMQAISNETETLMKNKVRFRVLGHVSRLSDTLRGAINALEEATAGNDVLDLIVFLSYSGKWDIFQAAKRFAAECREQDIDIDGIADETAFSRYLVTDGIPDPDLIIRTSGEQRISNYLLWQGAYSELLFVEKMWPEFGKEDFRAALAAYASRNRRYGRI